MQSASANGIRPELLTPQEMAEADRLAIAAGPYDGYELMRNAGEAVAAQVLRRFSLATGFDVLCGPGNNGGDGYVVARILSEAGATVRLFAQGAPKAGSDAAMAARDCPVTARPLEDFSPAPGAVVVDALFGAGLARPLEATAARAAEQCAAAAVPVVAIDLPSGVSGATGAAMGAAFSAVLTVTFFRLKPGHLLQPGRGMCGETIVEDIGIPASALDAIRPRTFVNCPQLWTRRLPRPGNDQHKYLRGHAAVFSGGPSSTGAARLSAMAAARCGSGATTLYSPANAIAINAAHLTSIMLRKVDDAADLRDAFAEREPDALVIGPGYGLRRPVREMVLAILAQSHGGALVLDADAITAFRNDPDDLFAAIGRSKRHVVMTPHEGEFSRLFSGISDQSKLERARQAASLSGAVVVLKGPDTVIAAPDGLAAINTNGTPLLATAGSGDVLAGIIAGLCAQKMPAWEAACTAVWMHADAAARFGPGLIAEDLPEMLPQVLRDLL